MYKTTQTLDVWILKMNTGQAGAGVNGIREADPLGPKASIMSMGVLVGEYTILENKNVISVLSLLKCNHQVIMVTDSYTNSAM